MDIAHPDSPGLSPLTYPEVICCCSLARLVLNSYGDFSVGTPAPGQGAFR